MNLSILQYNQMLYCKRRNQYTRVMQISTSLSGIPIYLREIDSMDNLEPNIVIRNLEFQLEIVMKIKTSFLVYHGQWMSATLINIF